MSLRIGCVADDFTGAGDAASFIRKGAVTEYAANSEGLAENTQTILYNGIPDAAETVEGNVVIGLKSRSIAPAAAVEQTGKAFRWLRDQGVKTIYFKYCSTFDSTPEGNIGPVADHAMELLDVPFTVLCPSLPVNGRTVKQGRLFVHGVPLDESPMRYHPLNPMWSSSIPELMAPQSRYTCLVFGREMLQKPVTEIRKILADFGRGKEHFYVIPDYETDEDGRRIAEVFGECRLLTGGSGLLEHLAEREVRPGPVTETEREVRPGPITETEREVRPGSIAETEREVRSGFIAETEKEVRPGSIVETEKEGMLPESAAGDTEEENNSMPFLLSGSCSRATREQLDFYGKHGGIIYMVDPGLVRQGVMTARGVWSKVSVHTGPVLVRTAQKAEDIVNDAEDSLALEQFMAQLAAVAREHGCTKFIVAGGETSGAVCRALGFRSFFVGPSVAPGVPVLTPRENPAMRLVLKSGNFGAPDFFCRALKMIRR